VVGSIGDALDFLGGGVSIWMGVDVKELGKGGVDTREVPL
jgi:hypothetical protein